METRRAFIKELFELEDKVGYEGEPIAKSELIQKRPETEIFRYLKDELNITFRDNVKIKELSLTHKNLMRMTEFKRKNEKDTIRIKELAEAIKKIGQHPPDTKVKELNASEVRLLSMSDIEIGKQMETLVNKPVV